MISLKEITWDNGHELMKLEVHESQKNFVAPNTRSLAQAFLHKGDDLLPAMPFAIYNDDELVGFTMMIFGQKGYYKDDDEPYYYLWRFMIGKDHQGKGYGKAAMAEVLAYLRAMPQGEAKSVYLSYDKENVTARKLYESFGFVETGEVQEDEIISRLVF